MLGSRALLSIIDLTRRIGDHRRVLITKKDFPFIRPSGGSSTWSKLSISFSFLSQLISTASSHSPCPLLYPSQHMAWKRRPAPSAPSACTLFIASRKSTNQKVKLQQKHENDTTEIPNKTFDALDQEFLQILEGSSNPSPMAWCRTRGRQKRSPGLLNPSCQIQREPGNADQPLRRNAGHGSGHDRTQMFSRYSERDVSARNSRLRPGTTSVRKGRYSYIFRPTLPASYRFDSRE